MLLEILQVHVGIKKNEVHVRVHYRGSDATTSSLATEINVVPPTLYIHPTLVGQATSHRVEIFDHGNGTKACHAAELVLLNM